MIVAGAAIVFAAPIANASKQRTLPQHKVTKHVTTHKGVTTGKGSKGGKITRPVTPTVAKPRPPLYIYIPGFTGTPAATLDSTQLCFQSMENCTDQQLCENWSMNCSTAGGSAASDTTPASPASTVEAVELGPSLAASVSDAVQDAPLAASDTTASVSTASNDEYEDC